MTIYFAKATSLRKIKRTREFIYLLEFNAAFNIIGYIMAVSALTHVFLAFSHQYQRTVLSQSLTTVSHDR